MCTFAKEGEKPLMKSELVNFSNTTHKIPRFNYNGEYILKPGEAVPIEDEQGFFFKPYAVLGIGVRALVDSEEKEDSEITKGIGEEIKEESVKESVKETPKIPKEKEDREETKTENLEYSAEELSGKTMAELRAIISEKGLEGNSNSKPGLINIILGK